MTTLLWIGFFGVCYFAYLMGYTAGSCDKQKEMLSNLDKELKRRSLDMQDQFDEEMELRTRALKKKCNLEKR